MVASRLFSNSGGRGCWRGVFLERDGGAHVLLSTPARKCLNQGSALKRGVSRTPLPRSLSAAGFVSHSRRQLLAKRRHGSPPRSRQHSLCASVSYVRHEMAVIRGRISSWSAKPPADHLGGQTMKRLTSAQLFSAPKMKRKTKARLARAKLVIAAARDRAVETAQQRRAPSMKRFPT